WPRTPPWTRGTPRGVPTAPFSTATVPPHPRAGHGRSIPRRRARPARDRRTWPLPPIPTSAGPPPTPRSRTWRRPHRRSRSTPEPHPDIVPSPLQPEIVPRAVATYPGDHQHCAGRDHHRRHRADEHFGDRDGLARLVRPQQRADERRGGEQYRLDQQERAETP